MPDPNDFNQRIIDEFRAGRGRLSGMFANARLVLLTTTGARSGRPHTTPVGYLPDGPERILVIASAGGSPRHPAWYHNLLAHPEVTVESGAFTYQAQAVPLTGAERDAAFARAVESDAGWAEYEEKAGGRVIPVVALTALTDGGPGNINAGSMGEAIKVVHDAFRRELALLRKEMNGTGSALGAQLRANCLTFCHGLHNHHTGEDLMLFPHLADRHPEIAPVLARLREEHERIAVLVAELRRAVEETADPVAARAEVERLTTDLEAHLSYEEEQLIPLLDAFQAAPR
ncbi:nitroreductase family deazaflavin-dependent oxidoreductase [Streptomyces sp. NPDC001595]|uniref:nitroreductase family deazaflavin-dependent oxidoreductase n=1 Tax=Streptomyces sp. NPDC001532 TaxID=3154520 RepID=UPI00331F450A